MCQGRAAFFSTFLELTFGQPQALLSPQNREINSSQCHPVKTQWNHTEVQKTPFKHLWFTVRSAKYCNRLPSYPSFEIFRTQGESPEQPEVTDQLRGGCTRSSVGVSSYLNNSLINEKIISLTITIVSIAKTNIEPTSTWTPSHPT